ncbi:hypothetical protein T4C_8428 [Trichinella pseudospiralis]|uniref:Uncharacterized protein n=1 Tax=Trichinella pseudospiralis TaxID=6337 RepID=A0A0V1GMS4_TRIPS|nr:hypothetical protein T4C_8428 [Trichinella pseudospiralis]
MLITAAPVYQLRLSIISTLTLPENWVSKNYLLCFEH